MQRRVLASLSLLTVFFSAQPVRAEEGDLSAAFKREFAFLEAEKSTLQKRLAEVEREQADKAASARNEIDQLQGRATHLSIEADRVQDLLADAEQASAEDAESGDVLDSTVQQAEVALSKGDFKLPAPAGEEITPMDRLSQLSFAFDKSVVLLKRYASVREEPGAFFGRDGKKHEGKIVHVGRVGAYGVADGAAGALAPAGEQRLRLWPQGETAQTARALADHRSPEQLNLFLYESIEKTIEQPKEKTVRDLLKAGGTIGYVIVALGLASLLMIIARAILLWRAAANTEELVSKVAPLVKRHDIDAALKTVRSANNAAGRVLDATLQNLKRPRDHLEDVISEAILSEQPTLDRFGSAIMVAAAVAPLLGLLGTVTGMIATFDVITEYGNGNPKLLAGGISEALVTTQFGLMVAIPALLLGTLLSGWCQRIKDDMDGAALRVTNIANGNDISDMIEDNLSQPPATPAALAPAE